MRIADPDQETRWPFYCWDAIRKTPIRSIVSFQLFAEHNNFGALNFCADTAGAFDDDGVEMGGGRRPSAGEVGVRGHAAPRVAVSAISADANCSGARISSAQPVAIALAGMLGARAVAGSCTSTCPRWRRIARHPAAPSANAPVRMTATVRVLRAELLRRYDRDAQFMCRGADCGEAHRKLSLVPEYRGQRIATIRRSAAMLDHSDGGCECRR
jgi:hypothetical protein